MRVISRQQRIAQFNQSEPPYMEGCMLLCEDHIGTYLLPFACKWDGLNWSPVERDSPLEVRVVGWKLVSRQVRVWILHKRTSNAQPPHALGVRRTR